MPTFTDRNGEAFELPKLTVALDQQIDAAMREADARERARAQLAVVKACLGASYAADNLGGKSVEAVDVAALSDCVAGIRMAYRMPEIERMAAQIEQLAPVMEQIDRMGRILGTAQVRNGFKRVV